MAIPQYTPPRPRTPLAPTGGGGSPLAHGIATFAESVKKRRSRQEAEREELMKFQALIAAQRQITARRTSGQWDGLSADEVRKDLLSIVDPIEQELAKTNPKLAAAFGATQGAEIDSILTPLVNDEREAHAIQTEGVYAEAAQRNAQQQADAARDMASLDPNLSRLGFERLQSLMVEEDQLIATRPEHLQPQLAADSEAARNTMLAGVAANRAINSNDPAAGEKLIHRIMSRTDFIQGKAGRRWTTDIGPDELGKLIQSIRTRKNSQQAEHKEMKERMAARRTADREAIERDANDFATSQREDGTVPDGTEVLVFVKGLGGDATLATKAMGEADKFWGQFDKADQRAIERTPAAQGASSGLRSGLENANSVAEVLSVRGQIDEAAEKQIISQAQAKSLRTEATARAEEERNARTVRNATETKLRRDFSHVVYKPIMASIGFTTMADGSLYYLGGKYNMTNVGATEVQRAQELMPRLMELAADSDGSVGAMERIRDLGKALLRSYDVTHNDATHELDQAVDFWATQYPADKRNAMTWMNLASQTDAHYFVATEDGRNLNVGATIAAVRQRAAPEQQNDIIARILYDYDVADRVMNAPFLGS